jgi:ribosomal protein S18 acetylase RimI-like enzyme
VIDVRQAAPADAASLAALRWEFRTGRAEAREDRESFLARCEGWMAHELRPGGAWNAWIALRETQPVGQVWLMLVAKVPNPVGERDRHAYLSNLYVIPSARGGIGERLLAAALACADAQRVDRVVLWPTPRSVRLYERHGFTRGGGEVMERSTK